MGDDADQEVHNKELEQTVVKHLKPLEGTVEYTNGTQVRVAGCARRPTLTLNPHPASRALWWTYVRLLSTTTTGRLKPSTRWFLDVSRTPLIHL
jgi:hypothetical protein